MSVVVCLDKDAGISSHDAVVRTKRALKVKKAGHAGTLDPMATGVLLVCIGEATKAAGLFSDLDKEYVATLKLGEATDTYDAEGRVVEVRDAGAIAAEMVHACIPAFRGQIEQVPPMYSALKRKGEPLYQLARRGIEVHRDPRAVTVHALDVLAIDLPFVRVRVSCSKGTYIRSLCHDIGRRLGVGAHMTELSRVRIGLFLLEQCARLQELPERPEAKLPLNTALGHLPAACFAGQGLIRIRHGNPVRIEDAEMSRPVSEHELVRLQDDHGNLVGIGRIRSGSIYVDRLFFF
ncbi:MAG TPA: tRNA pseudouridine(55) synthase TruB [Dissulfurispiraceae bacterium]|nr:tRNA pseudouridine(55) synthase TruB [Dissulfurispiraceae bacterium]